MLVALGFSLLDWQLGTVCWIPPASCSGCVQLFWNVLKQANCQKCFWQRTAAGRKWSLLWTLETLPKPIKLKLGEWPVHAGAPCRVWVFSSMTEEGPVVKFQRTKDKSKKGPAITSSGRLMDPELASEWFHMVPHGSTWFHVELCKPNQTHTANDTFKRRQ